MKNKIVVKIGLVFCVLAFLGISFARPSPASLVFTDLVFEGDVQFDLNGMYYVYGIGYPLNVLADLTVLDGEEKLGDLSLNGQKNFPDGSYFGHWAFDPVDPMGYCCDYEIGILPDLSQNEEGMLGFTLTGFNDENHFMSGSFEGSHHSDGVAVSDDGLMWYKVQGLTGADAISSGWRRYEVDLDAAVASAGITYNGSFKIKFQQYDNYPISTDGFAFDDITVDALDPGDSDDKPVWQEEELVRLINDIRSQYT